MGAGKLRVVEEVPVWDPKDPEEIWQTQYPEVSLDQRGAGGGRGFCQGDSGGPVYVQEEGRLLLWGVQSRVIPRPSASADKCDWASVVTDLRPYGEWIVHVMQDLLSKADDS